MIEFVRVSDPALRGDPTVCDLHRVDGLYAALPMEHEGELAADLDEIDVVGRPRGPDRHRGGAARVGPV
ncbi:hypothetical protein [Amycolatopsis sp. NPDC051372]|uniref:hypothetical protein n=1 Tax=unclassified Amycolatopsis TaxID=2618356 RepID=UPI00341F8C12